jgi:hypothetical protein
MSTKYTPNHEPLTIKEITDLLQEAKEDRERREDGSASKRAEIQLRLCRGIVGSTEPQRYEGAVGEAEEEIDYLYVSFLLGSRQSVDDLAVKLYDLMQTK